MWKTRNNDEATTATSEIDEVVDYFPASLELEVVHEFVGER